MRRVLLAAMAGVAIMLGLGSVAAGQTEGETTGAGAGLAAPTTLLAPVETVVSTPTLTPTTEVPVEVAASTVENVTTTEGKVRRVVLGLIGIGVVCAGLTVAFARHTSPRKRAALVSIREGARAKRLAAAAAVAQLGLEVRDPHEAAPDRARRVAPPPSRPVAPRPPAARQGPRPDPRPRPRTGDPRPPSG